jgi:hypothetical protein
MTHLGPSELPRSPSSRRSALRVRRKTLHRAGPMQDQAVIGHASERISNNRVAGSNSMTTVYEEVRVSKLQDHKP